MHIAEYDARASGTYTPVGAAADMRRQLHGACDVLFVMQSLKLFRRPAPKVSLVMGIGKFDD